MTNKLTKDDPEAKELTHLDVQFVSAVGNPATGKDFLLYKSKDKEAHNMSDKLTADQGVFKEFGRKLAQAFGVETVDESLAEATQHLAEIAAKASGRAPADDAGNGRNPNYPNPPYAKSQGIPNSNGATASVGSSAPGTTMKQQAEIVQGNPAFNSSMSDVVSGQPVTKDAIQEFLNRVEKSAINPSALETAREALEAAFNPAPEETHMTSEEVKELVLKALDPIIEQVEEHDETITTLKSSTDWEAKYNELLYRVDALEATFKNADGTRKVAKSRVPPVTEPVAKSSGVWAGSPFDISEDLL